MSKDRKPVIAVTFGVDDDQYLPPYVEAVERYGGEPRVLRPDGKPAGAINRIPAEGGRLVVVAD